MIILVLHDIMCERFNAYICTGSKPHERDKLMYNDNESTCIK